MIQSEGAVSLFPSLIYQNSLVKYKCMKIDILTLFPGMFEGPFDSSIIKRAQDKSLVEIKIHDLRQWARSKHSTVDDRPYGGGVGMVMMVEPIYNALSELLKLEVENESHLPPQNPASHFSHPTSTKVILLDPAGAPFNQAKAQELSKLDHLILLAGHYEGVDERVKERLIDEEISIGDYVLTGGELPAMVVVDSFIRLIPGVLKKPEATLHESFSLIPPSQPNSPLTAHYPTQLEYPHYTRPENFKGWEVPKILLTGNHKEIERWRKDKALEKTKKRRPDLLR